MKKFILTHIFAIEMAKNDKDHILCKIYLAAHDTKTGRTIIKLKICLEKERFQAEQDISNCLIVRMF